MKFSFAGRFHLISISIEPSEFCISSARLTSFQKVSESFPNFMLRCSVNGTNPPIIVHYRRKETCRIRFGLRCRTRIVQDIPRDAERGFHGRPTCPESINNRIRSLRLNGASQIFFPSKLTRDQIDSP